jgi:hypothetical protein
MQALKINTKPAISSGIFEPIMFRPVNSASRVRVAK